jgi:hypothetical protein
MLVSTCSDGFNLALFENAFPTIGWGLFTPLNGFPEQQNGTLQRKLFFVVLLNVECYTIITLFDGHVTVF